MPPRPLHRAGKLTPVARNTGPTDAGRPVPGTWRINLCAVPTVLGSCFSPPRGVWGGLGAPVHPVGRGTRWTRPQLDPPLPGHVLSLSAGAARPPGERPAFEGVGGWGRHALQQGVTGNERIARLATRKPFSCKMNFKYRARGGIRTIDPVTRRFSLTELSVPGSEPNVTGTPRNTFFPQILSL